MVLSSGACVDASSSSFSGFLLPIGNTLLELEGLEVLKMGRSPRRKHPPLAEQSRIASLAKREVRTVQESLVAEMLEAVGFQFREQWLLRTAGEALVFDFLVEGRVLVECTQSTHRNCSRAWTTLWRRAVYLDYKHRLAKEVGSFTTMTLLEVSHCKHHEKRALTPERIANLTYTDYVVTTIPALGEHLIGVLNSETGDPIPRWQARGLSRWLNPEPDKEEKP